MSKSIRHGPYSRNDYGEIEPVIVAYLNALAGGIGVIRSANYAGVHRDTIWRWRKEFPDFAHEEQIVRDRLYVRLNKELVSLKCRG